MSDSLSPSQAARRLGISTERVRQLALEGRLTAQDTPLGRLYDSADVERLRALRAASHDKPDPPASQEVQADEGES